MTPSGMNDMQAPADQEPVDLQNPEQGGEPDTDDQPMAKNELCVPLTSLAEPGENDAMETPAVGDRGQANIEYKVTRIEGENAYVTLDAVNGHKTGTPEGPPSEDEQMAQLQEMAKGMPEQ